MASVSSWKALAYSAPRQKKVDDAIRDVKERTAKEIDSYYPPGPGEF